MDAAKVIVAGPPRMVKSMIESVTDVDARELHFPLDGAEGGEGSVLFGRLVRGPVLLHLFGTGTGEENLPFWGHLEDLLGLVILIDHASIDSWHEGRKLAEALAGSAVPYVVDVVGLSAEDMHKREPKMREWSMDAAVPIASMNTVNRTGSLKALATLVESAAAAVAPPAGSAK